MVSFALLDQKVGQIVFGRYYLRMSLTSEFARHLDSMTVLLRDLRLRRWSCTGGGKTNENYERSDYQAPASDCRAALVLAEARANYLEVSWLNGLGVVCKYLGRFDEVEQVYRRALALTGSFGVSITASRDSTMISVAWHTHTAGAVHLRAWVTPDGAVTHIFGMGPFTVISGIECRAAMAGPVMAAGDIKCLLDVPVRTCPRNFLGGCYAATLDN